MKKILIVDDEPDVTKVISTYLQNAGYQILTADDGVKGLAVAQAEKPDLIISDVLMPNMEGYAFYKEIKKNPAIADTPVLILTGRAKMEESFRGVGVSDFIAKPFDGQKLLSKVQELLQKKEPPPPQEKFLKKVLVGGSDNEGISLMTRQLQGIGCQVESVTNGAEVIAKGIALDPDLFILDVILPGMATDMVVRVIRQMPNLNPKKVLLYNYYSSAELGSEDIQQKARSIDVAVETAMAAGATQYLGRFSEANFLKAVKALIA